MAVAIEKYKTISIKKGYMVSLVSAITKAHKWFMFYVNSVISGFRNDSVPGDSCVHRSKVYIAPLVYGISE